MWAVAGLFVAMFVAWIVLFLVDSWRTRRREKPARRLVVGFDPAVDDGTVVLFDPESRTIVEHWEVRQS